MIEFVRIEKNVGGMSHLAKHVIIPASNLKMTQISGICQQQKW